MLARQALARLEERAHLVARLGGIMPADFWKVFENARVALLIAERAVADKREALRKCT